MMRPATAAICLALAACGGGADAPPTSIAMSACRLPGVEAAARCGKLEVFEDREARSGRRIALSIAVVPARNRAREPDPIVIFAGGPGQGASALAAQVMPLFTRLNDVRDIVFLDQRGTGGSHPLACESSEPASLQAMFEDAMPERVVRECLEQLEADPRQYVTPVAVADLEEVRAALGYDKLNLWGGSYGTRVALEYLRRHPGHVRTMTLDGAAPATMKLPLSFVADGEAALKGMLDACDAEVRCRSTYPDLRASIAALRSQLARRPVRALIQNPRTGVRETIQVNENVFLSGLFRPLYVAEMASLLPYGVASAASGDFNPLLAQNLEFATDISENLSIGMHLSVVCSEDVSRVTQDELDRLDVSFFGRSLVDDFIRACRIWPRGTLPGDFYEPVASDVPALILSGGIDPATPPRHGEAVLKTLRNGRHVVAPHIGHGVSLRGCAPRLVESFIRTADARGLDTGCLERIPRPLFMLPLGVPSDPPPPLTGPRK
jgi:pimeloyl-ACP methyl ester carboxylesterase